jgi:hypothetical protein
MDMPAGNCTQAEHERMKTSCTRFAAGTVPLFDKIGWPWMLVGRDERLIVVANCATCGSTIGYDPRDDEEAE